MRKWISLLLAVLLVLGAPMTAMAIEVDTSYGDVAIYDTTVSHYNSSYEQQTNDHGGNVEITHGDGTASGTVTVDVNGVAESESGTEDGTPATGSVTITGNVTGGVYASGGASVTVDGSVSNAEGSGVDASDGASVTVTGDVTGGKNGEGVYAMGATVSVGGNVSGADNAFSGENGEGGTYVSGGNGVTAHGNSTVTVTGSVTGGDAAGGTAEGDRAVGGTAVSAFQATVTVGGNAAGGNAEGAQALGGNAVFADQGTVTVGGDAAGGTAEGGQASGGDAVQMVSTAMVTVNGTAAGGSGDGENSQGGSGIVVDVLPEIAAGVAPGAVTVKGEVSGSGDAPDILIFGLEEICDAEDVPSISVGHADSIQIDGFTAEEARQIEDSIKIGSQVTPSVSVEEKPQTQYYGVSTNGYSRGCLWRNGYIARTLFKVENGAGMKPVWTETLENGVLTITAENEPVVLTTWLEGLKLLRELGIQRIVVKTENCETQLVLADLIAMKGTEYVLTQKGDTATLTVDGKEAEI